MDCCQFEGVEEIFDGNKAQSKLADYREHGPQKTTRILVDALLVAGIDDHTLLDIGGGIGAIQHELLKAGVPRATDFEASSAYIEACKAEAARLGHANRIEHIHGNFANFGNEIPSADIVTLERVICCYPDMYGLVNESCTRTRRLLGLVFPQNTWWVKLGMEIIYNLKLKIQRIPFRVYMHPTDKVDATVRSHGFEQRFYDKAGPWQVMVYERVKPPSENYYSTNHTVDG